MLVAASLTAAERDQVESAVRIAIGVSIVVLLLASLFIWLAAGRAIAPLNALSRTARTISDTDLSSRIPVRGGDEIAELGRTFNGMLDRLETAFADQKDFLSDVSHELRTPITVIRGHLETLGDSPEEREEAIAVIQDELDRMSRYVDDLLLLAKAPRPDFLRTGPVDLDLFTHDLFAKARSLGDRDWRLDGTGVGIVVADQQRLTQAVMNLAENAVRHTGAGDAIWLGSSLVGDRARLWVRDEGPGIDDADRERIFARYERGDDAAQAPTAPGSGSRSSPRSPRRTAARSSSTRDPGWAPRSRIVIPAAPTAPQRREPDPGRRGRGAPGLVPGEGPASERLHDHGRRRRDRRRVAGQRRGLRPADPRPQPAAARTGSTCSATCAPRASVCR